MQEHRLSVVRACQLAGCSRTAWYRPAQDRSARDVPVIEALTTLVGRHAKWGFWLCFDTLRGTGHGWNWKRVYRVYRALGLNLPRRGKKRVLTRERVPLEAPAVLNRTWALDFMGDTLYDGRCYRLLTVLDEGNRESLALEVGTSLPSVRVVQPILRGDPFTHHPPLVGRRRLRGRLAPPRDRGSFGATPCPPCPPPRCR